TAAEPASASRPFPPAGDIRGPHPGTSARSARAPAVPPVLDAFPERRPTPATASSPHRPPPISPPPLLATVARAAQFLTCSATAPPDADRHPGESTVPGAVGCALRWGAAFSTRRCESDSRGYTPGSCRYPATLPARRVLLFPAPPPRVASTAERPPLRC